MQNINGKTKILCVSAAMMALYIAVMFATQHFAFQAPQIRIATGLYALANIFPFLAVPLALANAMSNFFFGSLGPPDWIGGLIAGLVTCGGIVLVKKRGLPDILIVPLIILGPGLLAPIWLSYLLPYSYIYFAISVCIGQILPAIAGYLLVKALQRSKIKWINL